MKKKYQRLRNFLAFCFRILSHVEIEGVEYIPREGGFVLATNHLSRLDTPLLGVACPRQIYALVAMKYKSRPFSRLIMEMADVIWVRRTEFDREALLGALNVLKRGDVLGLAPEGTRSPTHALQAGKPGVAFLTARAGVPIVPVAITGTEQVKAAWGKFRRPHLKVTFGKPFRLPKEGRLSSEELDAATHMIMGRIAVLLPRDYRGVYAEALAAAVS